MVEQWDAKGGDAVGDVLVGHAVATFTGELDVSPQRSGAGQRSARQRWERSLLEIGRGILTSEGQGGATCGACIEREGASRFEDEHVDAAALGPVDADCVV